MDEQVRQRIPFRVGTGEEAIVVTVHLRPAQFLLQETCDRRKTALKAHGHSRIADSLCRFNQSVELFECGAGRFLHKERFSAFQDGTGDGEMGRRRRCHKDSANLLVIEHFAERCCAVQPGIFSCDSLRFACRGAANIAQGQPQILYGREKLMNRVVAESDHRVTGGIDVVHAAKITQAFVASDERENQFHASMFVFCCMYCR